jgi:glycosyltransferase involved in cell wall biosynthesis
MRILHSLEGKAWSGGQQQALFLAKRQMQLGHEVLLMCQKDSVLCERAKEEGVQVWANDYRKEMHPVSIYQLLKAYDSFRPDVVNVHRAWAHTQWIIVSLLRRFRGLIVTRRVLFRPDFNPVSLAKYRTSAVRGYIAVSQAVKQRLIDTGVKPDKIRVVYSATDTDRFDPEKSHVLNGEWPVAPGKKAALLVGNFHRNKGHQLLINAFNRMADRWPELELVIAGNKTDNEELRELARSRGFAERVHLLGFRDDVPALMARSFFTLNASYQEGFSGTVRESLSLGIPVIASDIPANCEMKQNVPIELFKCGDETGLAEKMLQMKNRSHDESARNELRKLTVNAFSIDTMVKKTLKAYEELL